MITKQNNPLYRLFKQLYYLITESLDRADNYSKYGQKAPFVKAVEKVSGKTFDEIRSNRKAENVFWKAIFANLVCEYVFVSGTHLEIAIILKVTRTVVYHYLLRYKKSSNFEKMLEKVRREYEGN